MPIEVLSVRVREHPHEERTPSGVVSWTAAKRYSRHSAAELENEETVEGGRSGTLEDRQRCID